MCHKGYSSEQLRIKSRNKLQIVLNKGKFFPIENIIYNSYYGKYMLIFLFKEALINVKIGFFNYDECNDIMLYILLSKYAAC